MELILRAVDFGEGKVNFNRSVFGDGEINFEGLHQSSKVHVE